MRDFVTFNVILTPTYHTTPSPHGGGSMVKMISLDDNDDDDEKHIRKVVTKSNGVCNFAICLILMSFNILFSIMNVNHFEFFLFMKMKNAVSPPNRIVLLLHAKAVTNVVVATSTPSHHNNLLG